jgi:hypothetical protein
MRYSSLVLRRGQFHRTIPKRTSGELLRVEPVREQVWLLQKRGTLLHSASSLVKEYWIAEIPVSI